MLGLSKRHNLFAHSQIELGCARWSLGCFAPVLGRTGLCRSENPQMLCFTPGGNLLAAEHGGKRGQEAWFWTFSLPVCLAWHRMGRWQLLPSRNSSSKLLAVFDFRAGEHVDLLWELEATSLAGCMCGASGHVPCTWRLDCHRQKAQAIGCPRLPGLGGQLSTPVGD